MFFSSLFTVELVFYLFLFSHYVIYSISDNKHCLHFAPVLKLLRQYMKHFLNMVAVLWRELISPFKNAQKNFNLMKGILYLAFQS